MAVHVLRRVHDRYTLLEPIGRGGMGTVWRARDERLGRLVAVKEILPPAGLTPEEQELLSVRTLREARAAARLNSPGAVTVYDVVEQDDRPWIVMELLDARTLSEVLRDEGPLPAEQVARIGLAVLDALQAAHAAGVVHRDVKPANVLLANDGRVVLTDFGIAALDGDPTITTTGTVLGSPAYMAPERAHGHEPSPAMDLWSLGATLYAAISGRSPFQRSTALTTINAVLTEDVPEPPATAGALGPVLRGLLAKDPAQRIDAVRAHQLLSEAMRQRPPAPPPTLQTQTQVIDLTAADRVVAVGSGTATALTAAAGAAAPVRADAPAAGAAAPVRADAPAAGPAPVVAPTGAPPRPEVSRTATVDVPPPGPVEEPTQVPGTQPTRGAGPEPTPMSVTDRAPVRAAEPAPVRAAEPADVPATSEVTERVLDTPARQDEPARPPSGVPPTRVPPAPSGASAAPRQGGTRWPLGVLAALLLLALVGGTVALTGRRGAPAAEAPVASSPSPQLTPAAAAPAPTPTAASAAPATSAAATASPSSAPSRSSEAAAAPTPTASPAKSTKASATASPSSKASQKPSATTSAPAAAAPAGYRSYRDSTGFALSVPKGWTTQRKGGRVYFREPGGGRFLSIDQTRNPKADPEADWRRQEPAVAARFPGDQRISMQSLNYRGWRAADWEFRWKPSSGPLHVLNRNVVTGPSRAYALYFSVPESKWAGSQGLFNTVAGSFKPAAG